MPDNPTNNMAGQVSQPLAFDVKIKVYHPTQGVEAIADVKVNGILTIRNVKVKQDDYGYTATMPRTKMNGTEQYKDSVFFEEKSMKEAFDRAVGNAYHQYLIDRGIIEESVEEDESEEDVYDEDYDEEDDEEYDEEAELEETPVEDGIGMGMQ